MPSKNLTHSQKVAKNKRRAFSRTKNTLMKKTNHLIKVHDADVAFVVRKNDRCFTYASSYDENENFHLKAIVSVS